MSRTNKDRSDKSNKGNKGQSKSAPPKPKKERVVKVRGPKPDYTPKDKKVCQLLSKSVAHCTDIGQLLNGIFDKGIYLVGGIEFSKSMFPRYKGAMEGDNILFIVAENIPPSHRLAHAGCSSGTRIPYSKVMVPSFEWKTDNKDLYDAVHALWKFLRENTNLAFEEVKAFSAKPLEGNDDEVAPVIKEIKHTHHKKVAMVTEPQKVVACDITVRPLKDALSDHAGYYDVGFTIKMATRLGVKTIEVVRLDHDHPIRKYGVIVGSRLATEKVAQGTSDNQAEQALIDHIRKAMIDGGVVKTWKNAVEVERNPAVKKPTKKVDPQQKGVKGGYLRLASSHGKNVEEKPKTRFIGKAFLEYQGTNTWECPEGVIIKVETVRDGSVLVSVVSAPEGHVLHDYCRRIMAKHLSREEYSPPQAGYELRNYLRKVMKSFETPGEVSVA